MVNHKKEAAKAHKFLRKKGSKNEKKIRKEFKKLISFIEKIEEIHGRMILSLGELPPQDIADDSVRDLYCEAFDALYSAKELAQKGVLSMPSVLIRNAWESTLLITYFTLHPEKAVAWRMGKEVRQKVIHEAHKNHPKGGNEESQKEMYHALSKAAHPGAAGRIIAHRLLGSGNAYPIATAIFPEPISILENLDMIIRHWLFLKASIEIYYDERLFENDQGLREAMKEISDGEANKLKPWLWGRHFEEVEKYEDEVNKNFVFAEEGGDAGNERA